MRGGKGDRGGRRGREGEGKGKRSRVGKRRKGRKEVAVRGYSKSTRLIYTIHATHTLFHYLQTLMVNMYQVQPEGNAIW